MASLWHRLSQCGLARSHIALLHLIISFSIIITKEECRSHLNHTKYTSDFALEICGVYFEHFSQIITKKKKKKKKKKSQIITGIYYYNLQLKIFLQLCHQIWSGHITWQQTFLKLCTHLKNILFSLLTHWGRVTHICVVKLTIIGSDNGLSPGRRQAIIWTNAGILLIGPLGTNFSEILIEIHIFFIQENAFENVVCEMASIWSRPQWVNQAQNRD